MDLTAANPAPAIAVRRSLASSETRSHCQQWRPNLHLSHRRRTISPAPAAVISVVNAVSEPSEVVKAFTLPKDEILAALVKVEDTINQLEEIRSRLLDYSESSSTIFNETIKPQLDAALPFLQEASQMILKITSPMVSDAPAYAKLALQMAGVDPMPILSAYEIAAKAIGHATNYMEEAKPLASELTQMIKSSDPLVITAVAGALPALLFLLPPIWRTISLSLRGYKGDFRPIQALYLISSHGYVMMDIRSNIHKSQAGIPSLPPNLKNKIVSMPMEDLPSKLKDLVKDPKKVEANIAALKISQLKQVDKNTNMIVMDSYADEAKIVARTLTKIGFRNIWIVSGGFSGDRGWLWCRLGIDSYNIPVAEVVSPSTVIPARAAAAAVARFINSYVLRKT